MIRIRKGLKNFRIGGIIRFFKELRARKLAALADEENRKDIKNNNLEDMCEDHIKID